MRQSLSDVEEYRHGEGPYMIEKDKAGISKIAFRSGRV